MFRALVIAAAVCVSTLPALANDSMAELRPGGLIFVQTGDVAMVSEDLAISTNDVRVDYVFRNETDKDVGTVVAFPMPDLDASPFSPVAVPDTENDNFLDFSVAVDGKLVEPKLQMRAVVAGIDVTDDLVGHGVPLMPFSDKAMAATDALPREVQEDMARRGILLRDEYDQGNGPETHFVPYWTLRATYWWEMTFPAGREVRVQHGYKPSVGGTVGLTFLEDGKMKGEQYDLYRERYCFDAGFEKAVLKTVPADNPYGAPYFEQRLAYVLKTGGNWAGTIGKFHLTIDKGDPKNLVSFCGTGVEKTGPTTFEIEATDFYPRRDLDILILDFQEPQPQ